VQLHFIFPSFMSPRSYTEASDAENPEPRQWDRRGILRSLRLRYDVVAKSTILTRKL
jgi:hypothetical protein